MHQEPFNQTGYFDVTVTQAGGGSSLYQFEADLFLSGNPSAGLTAFNYTPGDEVSTLPYFANADLNTSVPYVFNGNSQNQTGSTLPFLDNYPGPSTQVNNSDDVNVNTGAALSSSPLGLMRVEYDVPANAPIGS